MLSGDLRAAAAAPSLRSFVPAPDPRHIVPAATRRQACISSSVAVTSAAEKILSDKASVVIAGGAETFSDVPIRLTRAIRQKLITLPKAMKKV